MVMVARRQLQGSGGDGEGSLVWWPVFEGAAAMVMAKWAVAMEPCGKLWAN